MKCTVSIALHYMHRQKPMNEIKTMQRAREGEKRQREGGKNVERGRDRQKGKAEREERREE